MMEGAGIVLAGGRSSRFGSNKALADWGGRPMAEAAVSALLAVFPKVFVVAKDPGPLKFLETARVRIVTDAYSEGHPLGGICTGLRALDDNWAFVAACDMPLIAPALIEVLWEKRMGGDAVVPVWGGRPQTLCAVYAKSALAAMESSISQGRLGIRDSYASMRMRYLDETELAAVDPLGASFWDIDSREEYVRVHGIIFKNPIAEEGFLGSSGRRRGGSFLEAPC